MWPDEYPGTFSTQPRRGRRTLVAAAKRVDRTLTRFITASYSERPKPAGVVVVRDIESMPSASLVADPHSTNAFTII